MKPNCVMEESSEDFQDLEQFPGYVTIYNAVARDNARSINRIITYKIVSLDISTVDL